MFFNRFLLDEILLLLTFHIMKLICFDFPYPSFLPSPDKSKMRV